MSRFQEPAMAFGERFSFVFSGSDGTNGRILVAGDSNVHRFQRFLSAKADLLPISGARFVSDTTDFRRQLRKKLCGSQYQYDKLYVHLGSNDVLCDEQRFYKNVTELCDLVQDLSSGTEIVLCEILPRGPDARRVTDPQRVVGFQRWVKRSNDMLWELCQHIPYMRFLSYGKTSQVSQYLSRDGLHLSLEGAEICCQALSNDFHMAAYTNALPEFTFAAEDWPVLEHEHEHVESTIGEEEICCKQYADILKELPDAADDSLIDPCTIESVPRKCPDTRKVVVVTRVKRRRKRHHLKRIPKRNRKLLPKLQKRSLHHPVDFVTIDITNNVQVEVRASLIQGSFLKHSRCPSPTELKKDRVSNICSEMHNKTLKKTKPMIQWFHCPGCKVRCSREDFLLDHYKRRHVPHTFESEQILGSTNTDSVKEPDTLISDDTIPSKDFSNQQYSATYQDKQLPSCEGSYCIFPASVWRIFMQLSAIHYLCGPEGLQHIVMLLVADHVDIGQLHLLLSNDVEQNPGPIYKCNWEHCTAELDAPGKIKSHVCDHVRKDQHCRWNGCCITEIGPLVDHVMGHLYQHEEYFTCLEDWFKFLPGGKDTVTDKTNLRNCPKHLRSKLRLLLLDEDFTITSNPYTIAQHKEYVNQISILNPSEFKKSVSEFLQKRESLGEEWTDIKEKLKLSNTTANLPKPFYIVPCNKKFDFVTTERSELGAKLFSGTVLKSRPRKRNHQETYESNVTENAWFNNLTNNLSNCEEAINLQKSILQTMLEKSLVTSKKQCWFKIETEAAKLAAVEKCTNGTFACSVFKCYLDEKEIIYVRYVESGVYSGLMLQQYVSLLKEKYNVTDDNMLLHNVITSDDIQEQWKENNKAETKTKRPDQIFKYTCEKVLPKEIDNLMDFAECPEELKLDSFVFHFLPFRSKVTVDNPASMFLRVRNVAVADTRCLFSDFRLNQLDTTNNAEVSSMDILNDPSSERKNLLQQSILLNCMSGDIRRNPALFKRHSGFESNFVHTCNSYTGTSLRNAALKMYTQRNFNELFSFFRRYFPNLDESSNSTSDFQTHNETPVCKKKRATRSVRKLTVTKEALENQLPRSVSESIPEEPVNIYESYCHSLLEEGKFSIRDYDESDLLVCCMNDYSEIDGSFKNNDFVCTIAENQETGIYFYCSCKIYRTLITLQECTNVDEELLVLDSEGENCVTCIHCTFLKRKVLPELEKGNMCETKFQKFLINAMDDKGKDIVELFSSKTTSKFSILVEGDDRPTFVHLSYNKRLNNHVVSCLNSKCQIMKGHKRSVRTLLSSDVCQHLAVFKSHAKYWEHLIESGNQSIGAENNEENYEDIISTEIDEENYEDTSISMESSDLIPESVEPEKEFFNSDTGLWHFPCKSTHSPNKKDSSLYKLNVLKRDNWNDHNLNRLSDGCLKGPNFVPDIPDNTCGCGYGWLQREDHEDYNADGRTMHEKSRVLTVYTLMAPVKCDIHSRICYNTTNPCKLFWDEGSLESLHVLSNLTSAGDEIGWEFVTLVMNSGCTFSSYCQLKNDSYKFRDSKAKFMHPTVFVKWWFSWAANMKIDFRDACDVCGFEPKRLCCDGTKVGVGFRHATFPEINASDPNDTVLSTKHRRMDRCFIKKMNGVTPQQMTKHRETLNYIARQAIGEKLAEKDQLTAEELIDRLDSVREIIPDAIRPSFDRFFTMTLSEKVTYAFVLKMLSTTASVTSLLPPSFCANLQQLVNDPDINCIQFNSTMDKMRSYAPELRDLIAVSMQCNDNVIPNDIRLFVQHLINESLSIESTEAVGILPQPDSYNPAKFGRAYYFNKYGLKLRNVRKFTIDNDNDAKRNVDHDDNPLEFERCHKLYSKIQTSAPGSSTLFLWFCADHGHCYGFHMTGAEGRKDPAASLYSYLEMPPQDIFYDFACNLQEYCLNRESGFYKNVRFFHDIFHSYAHKCSVAFKSNRLQGFESVNSEICEQFNSFIVQCMRKTGRQMSQTHFCFFLQFFIHEWNERKRILGLKKKRVALAGLVHH